MDEAEAADGEDDADVVDEADDADREISLEAGAAFSSEKPEEIDNEIIRHNMIA